MTNTSHLAVLSRALRSYVREPSPEGLKAVQDSCLPGVEVRTVRFLGREVLAATLPEAVRPLSTMIAAAHFIEKKDLGGLRTLVYAKVATLQGKQYDPAETSLQDLLNEEGLDAEPTWIGIDQ